MRRLFWVGVGAVGSVVAARRLRRAARRFTPEGVAEQAVSAGRQAGAWLQEAVWDFREAFEQRQEELVTALLVTPTAGTPARSRWDGSADDDEDDF